ncbi:hypothetical protein [Rhizobium alvei]|uniref:Uncharacterized protein n=1 Tax=Rhizobium alvei TaxID=1132659 RepID=A0ABT8YIP1_9HYPH|nr:hypothetical protein [Rhizobium alvei]MDO6963530.1 hypothetical protein [Rhizobium alvei]
MKIMLAVCTALGVTAMAAPSLADTVRIQVVKPQPKVVVVTPVPKVLVPVQCRTKITKTVNNRGESVVTKKRICG